MIRQKSSNSKLLIFFSTCTPSKCSTRLSHAPNLNYRHNNRVLQYFTKVVSQPLNVNLIHSESVGFNEYRRNGGYDSISSRFLIFSGICSKILTQKRNKSKSNLAKFNQIRSLSWLRGKRVTCVFGMSPNEVARMAC